MLRAFIAVDALDTSGIARVQNEIASEAHWGPRDVKSVEAGNFHFTIIFLGEIAATDAERLQSVLSQIEFESFSICYTGVGAFPRTQAARIIWIGVDQAGGQKLLDLAGKVVAATRTLGFSPDKPFSPHLTIFRVKAKEPMRLEGIAKRYDGVTFGTDMIDKVQLKKSQLTPSGPVYSNIYTVEAKKK